MMLASRSEIDPPTYKIRHGSRPIYVNQSDTPLPVIIKGSKSFSSISAGQSHIYLFLSHNSKPCKRSYKDVLYVRAFRLPGSGTVFHPVMARCLLLRDQWRSDSKQSASLEPAVR